MSNTSIKDAVNIHLAEYAALRAEILATSQLQMLYMGLPAGILALTPALRPFWASDWIIVLVLCCPALLYCNADSHIQNLARYIQCYLRPALLKDIENKTEILQWENYIRDNYGTQISRVGPFGKWAQFFQPLIVFVPAFLYFCHAIITQFSGWHLRLPPLILYTVDLIMLAWAAFALTGLRRRNLGCAKM